MACLMSCWNYGRKGEREVNRGFESGFIRFLEELINVRRKTTLFESLLVFAFLLFSICDS